MTAVLFVCMGNICRSPMAQGVLELHLRERNMLRLDALTVSGGGRFLDGPDGSLNDLVGLLIGTRHHAEIACLRIDGS